MSAELNMEIENRLQSVIEGEVRFRKIDRILYSTDASNFQVVPIGVVIPKSHVDVINTVTVAREHGVSILPRGGGTGLAGQSIGYGIVIDFSKYLNRILDVNTDNKTVRVEPGINLEYLNKRIANTGLMFGPDPSTANVATAGGVIGNNGTGTHSILYGMAGDNLQSARMVIHDGSVADLGSAGITGSSTASEINKKLLELRETKKGLIERDFPKHWRTASGYSLNYMLQDNFNPARLIASSEGTFGAVTELELDLVDKPAEKGIAILQFDTLQGAIDTVPGIVQQNPSAVELIDGMLVDLTREHKGYSHLLSFVKERPAAILVVEFYGITKTDVENRLSDFLSYCRDAGVRCRKDTATDPADQKKVWSLRKAGLGLLMSKRSDFKPVPTIEDVSVPVEKLPEYVEDIVNTLDRFNLKGGFYGHASAGCLHIRPLINLKTRQGKQLTKELERSALELCMKYGGVMSGEHGDGIQRSYLNELLFGRDLYGVMTQLKTVFDPEHIFNPGKVVNSPEPEDADYRYSEKLKPVNLTTYLDWSREKGFLSATEMCNGQGVCRKPDEGIMCPSFMATRDEKDTTRARANTLRAVLSGRISPDSLNSSEVYDVFDLCISCKACGNECPSSVDVAKMKTEYLAQYKYRNGFTIRDRIFGNIHRVSKLNSYFPSVVNYMSGTYAARIVTERIGISQERNLPQYADKKFSTLFRDHGSENPSTAPNGKVVYFHDTWTEYFYPEIGEAACGVLRALGYEPEIVFKRECCGRPLLSKGMVKDAKELAHKNTELLGNYVSNGIPVVGTEASCISALKDDYMSLVPGEVTTTLSQNSFMLDEFMVDTVNKGKADVKFEIPSGKVLFHGHCHQRSLSGIEGTVDFLRSKGFDINDSNATCCGMAGSFGYEDEHYEISGMIGNERLFPAVNTLGDNDIVCVTGVSCLEQISHFTKKDPVHLAVLINDYIKS